MGPQPPPWSFPELGPSTWLGKLIEALWLVAGAAMLAFTAFLAVLVVAGVLFRLGRSNKRRHAVTVFSLSSMLVIAPAIVIFAYDPFRDADETAPLTSLDTGSLPVNQIYPAVSGLPLRYANGGASGDGLRASKTRALVLYGSAGDEAVRTELSATKLTNLISHFGGWTAHPVGAYRAGDMVAYDAVFYLGTADGTRLPPAFLDDVLRSRRPVVWIRSGIDRLAARDRTRWAHRYGFSPRGLGTGQFTRVRYKGTSLPMDQPREAKLMRVEITDPARAKVLATAVRADGASTPWAVRSANLIYVSEDALPHIADDNDRYLAFADLLFEAMAPPHHTAPPRVGAAGGRGAGHRSRPAPRRGRLPVRPGSAVQHRGLPRLPRPAQRGRARRDDPAVPTPGGGPGTPIRGFARRHVADARIHPPARSVPQPG